MLMGIFGGFGYRTKSDQEAAGENSRVHLFFFFFLCFFPSLFCSWAAHSVFIWDL